MEPGAVKQEVGPRGFTGRRVIDEYHADGGGKLRKDEFHKPARIFSRIYTNNAGLLTREESETRWRALKAC